eukprot:COSAG06_NODE_1046_length_10974_cov_9.971405_2_plen_178_part_00
MGWWPGRADGSADGYTRVSGWRGVLVMKRLVVPGLDAFPFSFHSSRDLAAASASASRASAKARLLLVLLALSFIFVRCSTSSSRICGIAHIGDKVLGRWPRPLPPRPRPRPLALLPRPPPRPLLSRLLALLPFAPACCLSLLPGSIPASRRSFSTSTCSAISLGVPSSLLPSSSSSR